MQPFFTACQISQQNGKFRVRFCPVEEEATVRLALDRQSACTACPNISVWTLGGSTRQK